MKIAIQGCCHNTLDIIYETLKHIENVNQIKIDLLLICGDFESIRNLNDLDCMNVPEKYKELGSFYKYYSGKEKAPYLTIFIGGNHEAINYLWELYYGGWVCDNIYFMGYSNVINFGGLRIGGASGIYYNSDYNLGYHETYPYNRSSKISSYHVRFYEIYKLLQIQKPMDIFLSHDWPQGISYHGDLSQLLRQKPAFEKDINSGKFGCPPFKHLLYKSKPKFWFAAHHHVKFAALVHHDSSSINNYNSNDGNILEFKGFNIEEKKLDEELGEEINEKLDEGMKEKVGEGKYDDKKIISEVPGDVNENKLIIGNTNTEFLEAVTTTSTVDLTLSSSFTSNIATTRFLSLDKCVPGRKFLQILDFPNNDNEVMELKYDEEWLAIIKATNPYFSTSHVQEILPTENEINSKIETELKWIKENISNKESGLLIPKNFRPTAPAYDDTLSPTQQKSFNTNFIAPLDDMHDPLFDIRFKNGLLSFSEPSSLSHSTSLLKKRAQPPPPKKSSKVNPPGISIDNQEATSETLEHELHKHYEEESEDWWEVYRSYEYETADSLGNMFLVEVEEAQVIHKQHALMDDLQHADVSTKEYASQETLNTGGMVTKSSKDNDNNKAGSSFASGGGGIQQVQDNVNNTSIAEARFVQYEYTLEIDLFNQWEYQSEQVTSKNDNLELIN
ncbi:12579_t:CDS:10 [Entrophospora sp. SA101]|nr:12579_t:CDS:10 [Entrophospora sp. SA101]CAJ0916735.1 4430_t:CDS:10 [Entrophospora sp. SA101]